MSQSFKHYFVVRKFQDNFELQRFAHAYSNLLSEINVVLVFQWSLFLSYIVSFIFNYNLKV